MRKKPVKPRNRIELVIDGAETSKNKKSEVSCLGILSYIYLHRIWKGNGRRNESDTFLVNTHMYMYIPHPNNIADTV